MAVPVAAALGDPPALDGHAAGLAVHRGRPVLHVESAQSVIMSEGVLEFTNSESHFAKRGQGVPRKNPYAWAPTRTSTASRVRRGSSSSPLEMRCACGSPGVLTIHACSAHVAEAVPSSACRSRRPCHDQYAHYS